MKRLTLAMLLLSAFMVGFQGKAKPTFVKNVQPLIKANCVSCHSGPNAPDKVDLFKIKTEADAKKNLAMLKKSLKEVKEGHMPPKGMPRPTAAQVKLFEAWVKAQGK